MKNDMFAIKPVQRGKVRKSGAVFRGKPLENAHTAANGNACLYAITTNENEYVKIGYSKCPGRRLRDLQTGSPYELFLLFYIEVRKEDAKKLEKAMHAVVPTVGGAGRGEWWVMDHEKIAGFFLGAAEALGIDVVRSAGGVSDAESVKRQYSVCARNGGGQPYKP